MGSAIALSRIAASQRILMLTDRVTSMGLLVMRLNHIWDND